MTYTQTQGLREPTGAKPPRQRMAAERSAPTVSGSARRARTMANPTLRSLRLLRFKRLQRCPGALQLFRRGVERAARLCGIELGLCLAELPGPELNVAHARDCTCGRTRNEDGRGSTEKQENYAPHSVSATECVKSFNVHAGVDQRAAKLGHARSAPQHNQTEARISAGPYYQCSTFDGTAAPQRARQNRLYEFTRSSRLVRGGGHGRKCDLGLAGVPVQSPCSFNQPAPVRRCGWPTPSRLVE